MGDQLKMLLVNGILAALSSCALRRRSRLSQLVDLGSVVSIVFTAFGTLIARVSFSTLQ